MDEGDRSDGDGEPDRETGAADRDVESGESIDTDSTDDDEMASDEDAVSGGESERAGGGGTEPDRPEAEPDRPEAEPDRPEAQPDRPDTASDRGVGASDESVLHRFRHDREGPLMWIREMLSSVAVVLLIGLILFGVSGVWPPMVAVESGSMEPNMEVGDLVFVTEPGRLAPDAADNDVGVVTHEVGETADYRTFGSYGSVVIYRPPGRTASPIIHRAMFHVEEGENWYDRADGRYHSADDCGDLNHCPAPHSGFITLGDNNGRYDQASGLAAPVKPDWVTGVARVRVPYLGYVRLIATGQAEPSDVIATSVTVRMGPIAHSGVGGGVPDRDRAVSAWDSTVSDVTPSVSGGDVTAATAG
ncbi:S26 family signal peptidase [Halorubrum persicum]|uniref:S26 family signal peptidase n=1 Tax=Halorubrum persicum TaxID=1383844 RepID=A0A2G1WJ48_9EURY|nr:S26 family signal peptidase [Halorubrum persicum]PHQ39024.1 S26 family signal peptidase [Halorubrum persicum]